jgi:YbgC/YbaW family acyl-CoA thioester hydrolase
MSASVTPNAPLSEYRFTRRVQFYETDVAGIVHFSWFYRYMEEAEHALWREAGLSIHPEESEVGWPRVSASFDFHRALRFEDEFEVALRIVEITNRRIRYACVLEKEKVKIATGTMTVACVRKRPGRRLEAIDIPPEIASRFEVHDSRT